MGVSRLRGITGVIVGGEDLFAFSQQLGMMPRVSVGWVRGSFPWGFSTL